MRIKAEQYASALYQVTAGKTSAQVKSLIVKLAEKIMANRDSHKLPAIIKSFNQIWNREHNLVEAEVESARKLDSDTIRQLKSYIKKLTLAKELVIKQVENKDIIGGIIIKYGDKVVDASLKTRIIDLRDKLSK